MLIIKIIKDSIILFLLIYALMDICRHITACLIKQLHNPLPRKGFYVLDLSEEHPCRIEYHIRCAAEKYENIYLITDESPAESQAMVEKLSQSLSNINLVTRFGLMQMIANETERDAFSAYESAKNHIQSK